MTKRTKTEIEWRSQPKVRNVPWVIADYVRGQDARVRTHLNLLQGQLEALEAGLDDALPLNSQLDAGGLIRACERRDQALHMLYMFEHEADDDRTGPTLQDLLCEKERAGTILPPEIKVLARLRAEHTHVVEMTRILMPNEATATKEDTCDGDE